MQEIRASFFVECEELLEALQDALQMMESGEADSETINVAFRAVHSIKGGAGAFGLNELVAFAHSFETTMDELRAGRLEAGADTIALFFQCGDLLSDLVRVARDGGSIDDGVRSVLLTQLKALVGDAGETAEEEVLDFQPMGISLDLPGLGDLPDLDAPEEPAAAAPDILRRIDIRFVPEPELYRAGNEPVFLLRALAALGDCSATCIKGDVPDLAEYDATTSILGWQIALQTNVDEEAVREVFDFVDGLCHLTISDKAQVAPEVESPAEERPAFESDANEAAPVDPGQSPEPEPVASQPELPKEKVADRAGDPNKAKPVATVRVDLDRIDRMVNLVGELVINQAMLAQSVDASGLSSNTKIATGLDEFQQLTRDIQDSVMLIRAQPVKSLFQRMARIVRESSADVGKTVRLKTEGEATEIDKTVIERLSDPLTHMIRNAVDHGLETPDERRAAGKPAEGIVSLRASHRSGRVIVEIADNGAGINRPKVRQIAVEKGLIPAEQELTDAEIDNLLFMPGFSTASEVSNLSGRGVGMDVVKNAISALGGRTTITSTPGEGTTFSISLPLTLAVLDGMVVRVGTETLVVPLSAISETLSLQKDDARTLGPQTQVVRVRETFVPLIDLGTELGYSGPRASYEGAIVLLISHEDGERAALVVDAIEDQRQVVIKGLQDSYGHVPGVAAATILGDGQIALILDPADLLQNASGLSRPNQLARTG